MLLFCNKVHITTVWVHQIAPKLRPLTHKYSNTNTSGLNDRVTRVTGLWYRVLQISVLSAKGCTRPPVEPVKGRYKTVVLWNKG